jgi:hypothetical protein
LVIPAIALTAGAAARPALAAPTRRERRHGWILLRASAVAAVLLAVDLPNAWDTQAHHVVNKLWGVPARPFFLNLHALGTLLVVGVAAVIIRGEAPHPSQVT